MHEADPFLFVWIEFLQVPIEDEGVVEASTPVAVVPAENDYINAKGATYWTWALLPGFVSQKFFIAFAMTFAVVPQHFVVCKKRMQGIRDGETPLVKLAQSIQCVFF
jgi:hypothetical protein